MGNMKQLLQVLLNELGSRCATSTTSDQNYIAGRMETEGDEFLTISLPAFAKDLERCLDQGFVSEDAFRGFKKRSLSHDEKLTRDVMRESFVAKMGHESGPNWQEHGGPSPLFLGGFLAQIFHPLYGYLRNYENTGCWIDQEYLDRQTDAIQAIRQISLMFAKIDKPCSDARVRRALSDYVATDQVVAEFEREWSPADYGDFSRISNLLFGDVFSRIDRDVYAGDVVPKHGPGATADKLKGNQKFDQLEWPERLDAVFPAGEYLLPNWRYYKYLDRVTYLEPGAERPVRVITVPKTASKPRIIAIEPTAMQYMQQALLEKIVEAIEGDELLSAFVGFTDQIPNQDMAREGSLNGEFATLDLSEASDRVSVRHVEELFAHSRNLLEAMMAVRSTKADVDGHGIISLAKYASMGSATCFPVEAMVFLTSIFMGIERHLGVRMTRKIIRSYVGKVRVYGDDIIVPVDVVEDVVLSLETRNGFKVNRNKSFWTGKFRESCGKEFYAGADVSIVRVRRELPANISDAEKVVSAVSMRNQFYWSGLWQTAFWLDDKVISKVLGPKNYPVVEPSSSVLGRHSCLDVETQRMSPTLHKPLVRGYVVRAVIPVNKLDDTGALLKWFLKRGSDPFDDANHLERSGRPVAVSIKLQWASPH